MTVKTKNIFKRLVAALLPFVLLSMYSVSCFATAGDTVVVATKVEAAATSASTIKDTEITMASASTPTDASKIYLKAIATSSNTLPDTPLPENDWITAESIGATISSTTLTLPKSYIQSLYTTHAKTTGAINVFLYAYHDTEAKADCILALRFDAIPKFTAATTGLTWNASSQASKALTIGTLANAKVANLTEIKLWSGDTQVTEANDGTSLKTSAALATLLEIPAGTKNLTIKTDLLKKLDYGTYKLTFKLNGSDCSVSFTVTDDPRELEAVVKEGEAPVATLTFLGAISADEPKIAVRKIEPAYPSVIWSYDLTLKDRNGKILKLESVSGDKTLKLIVGAQYAGKKVIVFHGQDQLESTETETKYFTVGQAGGIDIKVASLSPFTVVLADGQTTGDNNQTGDQGNNNVGDQGSNNGTQTGTGTGTGTGSTNKGNAGSLKTGDAFYGLFSLVNTIASAFGFELIRRKKFNG